MATKPEPVGPTPILTEKIRVDRGRGRIFPDSQSWVWDRGWDYQYPPRTCPQTRPTNN